MAKLTLFDNTRGYVPSQKLKEWWLLLPQTSTTYQGSHRGEAGKTIPPLFGDPKNVAIHFILVFLLIIAEIVLMYQLEENGVDYKVLLILSIIDFVVAILPVVIVKVSSLDTKAEIKARAFIAEAEMEFNLADTTADAQEKTLKRESLRDNLLMWQGRLRWHKLLNTLVVGMILAFSGWKFFSFYAVLGADIFIEPIGRFIVGVILLSIAVHLISTKTVFVASFFFPRLWNELRGHTKYGDHAVDPTTTNVPTDISYAGKYTGAVALFQRVVQDYDHTEATSHTDEKTSTEYLRLQNGNLENWYLLQDFDENGDVKIVTTGLLTDPELNALAGVQDAPARLQILATGKEIQLRNM